MANFEASHIYFSHALCAAPEKINLSYVNVRNSSVSNIKQIKALNSQAALENIEQSKNKISLTNTAVKELNSSTEALIALRAKIQSLLTQAPSPSLDAHADLFHESDASDSDKNEWENIGSDEEIIS